MVPFKIISLIVLGYLLIMNISTFILFAIDKHKAVHGKWRIPEKTLILFSVFGGALGGLISMYAFHHKTKKKRFSVVLPILLILQIGILIYLFVFVL